MSTYWTVGCLDCPNDHDFELRGNHQDAGARRIAEDAAKLAVVGELLPTVKIDVDSYDFYSEGGHAFLAAWFTKHKGHRVRARTEYGEWAGTCMVWLTHRPFGTNSCARNIGHEGDHSSTPDPPT